MWSRVNYTALAITHTHELGGNAVQWSEWKGALDSKAKKKKKKKEPKYESEREKVGHGSNDEKNSWAI